MKVLVLGASGMLGHVLLHELPRGGKLEVAGTVRSRGALPEILLRQSQIFENIDIRAEDTVVRTIGSFRPDAIINCVGIIKQLPEAHDPLISLGVNSMWPHKLARLCEASGARLIHISTDCVFSGSAGSYTEDALSDALDLYGKTKFLGEVHYPWCITLRTSIIGHELQTRFGLVEWFLSQKDHVRGFTRAVFSGFSTLELARIIRDVVIPDAGLSGLYHVSSNPVSKHDLLRTIARVYRHSPEIASDSAVVCDRSLDSERFKKKSGYNPPGWDEMIQSMHDHFERSGLYPRHSRKSE